MRWLPSEVFEQAEAAETKQEKIDILHKYDTPVLRQILKHTYEPRITFDDGLREGNAVAWKPDKAPQGLNPSNLWQEFRKVKYFYDSPSNTTPANRRVKVLRDILESVHENDAYVMLGVLAKDLPYTSIDAELVIAAFPNLWAVDISVTFLKEDEVELTSDDSTDDSILEDIAQDKNHPLSENLKDMLDTISEHNEQVKGELTDGTGDSILEDNLETERAFEDAHKGNVETFDTVDELKEDVEQDKEDDYTAEVVYADIKPKTRTKWQCPYCAKKPYKTEKGLDNHVAKKHNVK